ncbi:MAG: hypothetical protein JSS62_05810 [Verrucomicrobia bacterium]|nr:hypothetical protein [Verrucomicrobiota bacterium]MBS0647135.1 hypothetical protein [Verrucomicrobiota bacterium]
MDEAEDLEAQFSRYWDNLPAFLPDGMIEVDLQLLQDLHLLQEDIPKPVEEDVLAQDFYVLESAEKLTLFNERFAIWIVPKITQEVPTTYTLIARKHPLATKDPHLEIAFSTTGVYNHSGLVLRILERFLEQIDETEAAIIPYDQS